MTAAELPDAWETEDTSPFAYLPTSDDGRCAWCRGTGTLVCVDGSETRCWCAS